ncbi:hypothetical protein D3C80_1602340 [compost metagenome]
MPACTQDPVRGQFFLRLLHQRHYCFVVVEVYRTYNGGVRADVLNCGQWLQFTHDIFNEVLPVYGVWIEHRFLGRLFEDLSDLVLVEVRLQLRAVLQNHPFDQVRICYVLSCAFKRLVQTVLIRYVYTYSLK